MNFFKYFNTVDYTGKKATNIMNSVLLKYANVSNTTLYFYYTIKDDETPESISYNTYRDVDYHWVILLINNIVDPYYQWPMGRKEFDAFVLSKYGDNLNNIHHFNYEGRQLHPDQSIKIDNTNYISFNELHDDWKAGGAIPQNIFPITNTEYEISENDKNREIKILNKEVIDKFVDQFVELMNGTIQSGYI